MSSCSPPSMPNTSTAPRPPPRHRRPSTTLGNCCGKAPSTNISVGSSATCSVSSTRAVTGSWRGIGSSAGELLARLDGAAAVELHPELEMPRYYVNCDIHQHPGGVWSDDVAGFVYERAASTTTPLAGNKHADLHDRFTDVIVRECAAPQRVLDMRLRLRQEHASDRRALSRCRDRCGRSVRALPASRRARCARTYVTGRWTPRRPITRMRTSIW